MVSSSGLREWFTELLINRGHQLKWWLIGVYLTINVGSLYIWGFETAGLPLASLWLTAACVMMELAARAFRQAALLNRATRETWELMDKHQSEQAQRESNTYWSGTQAQ